jgi:hypothetical protein
MLLAVACPGCGPHALAPIVRSTHYGAPASLPAGHLAAGGATSTAEGAYWTGGPTLAYARPEEVLDWWSRWAVGWYSGLGVAFHASYLALFARGRVQGSGAAQVPGTLWWTALVGLAGDVLGWADVYFGAGYAGLQAGSFGIGGWFLEMGFGVDFSVGPRRATRR